MRVMTVEIHRDEATLPGFVRVELAPSVRVTPNGVYIGINGHFQLSQPERRADAAEAALVLRDQWDDMRALETSLVSALLEEYD
jgi:hypothetical protein